jgi:hypothetical protein
MTDFIEVASIIVTVFLAYIGIQRQQQASLRLQEEHLKSELKVRLYPEIAEALHRTAHALHNAAWGYENVVNDLKRRPESFASGPLKSSAELADLHRDAARQITDLLMVFEKYEIVFARFASMRREFSEEHLRLLDAHSSLFSKLLPFLPNETWAGSPGAFPFQPGQEDLVELEGLAKAYRDVEGNLQGYILDASVEAQKRIARGSVQAGIATTQSTRPVS